MGLKEKLEHTMHEAMRNRDELTRNTMRLVLAAIKQAEVESRASLDDQGILAILQKEVKIRTETIKELANANRADLVDQAAKETEILNGFLPRQLSNEELSTLAIKAIAEVGASNPADMGKVMKVLLPSVKGLAQPERVSRIVKELLNG
jgi:hypothetical protein